MKLNLHTKKVKVSQDVKDYVEQKLNKLNKYFKNENLTATVQMRESGKQQVVEVTIPVKSIILRAEERQKEFKAAIDLVVDKLERQIRKNKTRMNKKDFKLVTEGFITDFETKKEEKDKSKVAKRKTIELKPMSEEEAILQMNLIGHEFFLYRNAKTHELEVIYKRNDGNYGIIKEK